MAKDKDTTGFGERLRALRVAAGLTQQQLADQLGMKATNITRLETGGRTPSWETVLKIAKVLNVPTDDFKSQERSE